MSRRIASRRSRVSLSMRFSTSIWPRKRTGSPRRTTRPSRCRKPSKKSKSRWIGSASSILTKPSLKISRRQPSKSLLPSLQWWRSAWLRMNWKRQPRNKPRRRPVLAHRSRRLTLIRAGVSSRPRPAASKLYSSSQISSKRKMDVVFYFEPNSRKIIVVALAVVTSTLARPHTLSLVSPLWTACPLFVESLSGLPAADHWFDNDVLIWSKSLLISSN